MDEIGRHRLCLEKLFDGKGVSQPQFLQPRLLAKKDHKSIPRLSKNIRKFVVQAGRTKTSDIP